jgi:hypothetical protein
MEWSVDWEKPVRMVLEIGTPPSGRFWGGISTPV